MDKYQEELINIKLYLQKHGEHVDKVIRWQSGFRHSGTDLGLPIRITAIKDGDYETEYIYCVPRCALKNEEQPNFLFVKKYKREKH